MNLMPAPLMVVSTGLGEVFLKLIIMSLVLTHLVGGRAHHTKIQSRRPQAHGVAPRVQEDLKSQKHPQIW